MVQKVAVAFVHGMGGDAKGYSKDMQKRVLKKIEDDFPNMKGFVVMGEVNWSSAFQSKQNKLMAEGREAGLRNFFGLRDFLVSYLTDTISYQIFKESGDDDSYRAGYDKVHVKFAEGLHQLALAAKAGPTAPLIIVAHSLGTVIASNYIYDLQNNLMVQKVKDVMDINRPLERGETLHYLFTMGSPLTIYNMRFDKPPYGKPIQLPAPNLSRTPGKRNWLNFYDKDDLIAFPIADKNELYDELVHDEEIVIQNLFTGHTPFSHDGYWSDMRIVEVLCEKINELGTID